MPTPAPTPIAIPIAAGAIQSGNRLILTSRSGIATGVAGASSNALSCAFVRRCARDSASCASSDAIARRSNRNAASAISAVRVRHMSRSAAIMSRSTRNAADVVDDPATSTLRSTKAESTSQGCCPGAPSCAIVTTAHKEATAASIMCSVSRQQTLDKVCFVQHILGPQLVV